MRSALIKLSFICLISALSACAKEAVVQDITQDQAREISAALFNEGIDSDIRKESGARGKFKVEVNSADTGRVLSFLAEKKLPAPASISSEELFSGSNFLPGSREIESIKADYLRSIQIERLISEMNGVADAKVLVRTSPTNKPNIAIVIKTKNGALVSKEEIYALVTKMVDGASSDNLSISFSEQEALKNIPKGEEQISFLWFAKVAAREYKHLLWAFIIGIGLIGSVLGIAGYWLGRYQSKIDDEDDSSPRTLRLSRMRSTNVIERP